MFARVVCVLLALLSIACGADSANPALDYADGEQPYDDEPIVDAGVVRTDQDSGSAQVVTQDAGTQERDGSAPKVDASVGPTPDAAVFTRDGGSVPDANVSTDAAVPQDASSQPDTSTPDAGVVVIAPPPKPPAPYLQRVCSTSADCMQPFTVYYPNGVAEVAALPRPAYDSPAEQPLCVIKAGATTGRCSFYCKIYDPTGATLGSWYPDQNRWCQGFNAQCSDVGTGTACMLGGIQ